MTPGILNVSSAPALYGDQLQRGTADRKSEDIVAELVRGKEWGASSAPRIQRARLRDSPEHPTGLLFDDRPA